MAEGEAPRPDAHAQVLEALRTKACMKQDVYDRARDVFAMLKELCAEMVDELQSELDGHDERVKLGFLDKGATVCELRLAGDLVIFNMHTNVFRLDQSHALWRSAYLQEDEMRGYFGVVNVYNFLNDSILYNRERDLGYLVARMFINKDGHFLMQGKRQLNFLFNDLQGTVLDRALLKDALYAIASYAIEFDLLLPPYDHVNQVSVSEMKEIHASSQLSTGKRLGFRFQADVDELG